MSNARSDVLGRIRSAIGRHPRTREDDYASVPRAYRQTASLSREECLQLFEDRLRHYDAGVYRCALQDLPATIATAVRRRNKRRIVIPAELSRDVLPTDVEFVPDTGLSPADLDRVDGVLTGCTVAIAITGTIVLRHASAEGRRAITLVPDYHLCVVDSDHVVETVPEAFRRIAALQPRLLTTISGPSATADIEMTRIKGVHGPRTLDVILIQS
jgi:L-lactate dehydrogenase complex protein LldG